MFLAQLQKFSSILAGDGSVALQPFSSFSLKWDPVLNASGAVVYLVEMTFTGEQSRFSPQYLSEVNRPDITFRSSSLSCWSGLAVRHVKTSLFFF